LGEKTLTRSFGAELVMTVKFLDGNIRASLDFNVKVDDYDKLCATLSIAEIVTITIFPFLDHNTFSITFCYFMMKNTSMIVFQQS